LRFNTTRPERIPSSRSASASFHDSMCLDAKGSNPNTLILCECMLMCVCVCVVCRSVAKL
jgi:hypothetical protein